MIKIVGREKIDRESEIGRQTEKERQEASREIKE